MASTTDISRNMGKIMRGQRKYLFGNLGDGNCMPNWWGGWAAGSSRYCTPKNDLWGFDQQLLSKCMVSPNTVISIRATSLFLQSGV